MKLAFADIVRRVHLPFGNGSAPLDAAVRESRVEDVLNEAGQRLRTVTTGAENDIAALYALAHAFARKPALLDRHVARAASQWLDSEAIKNDARAYMLFGAVLADEQPQCLAAILDELTVSGRDVAGLVFALCGYLPSADRTRMLMALAHHPLDSAREHFFALLGKHQRLVPPGSAHFDFVPEETMNQVLASGIGDGYARVRERAIAAAYGLGLVDALRELVIARTRDDDHAVRQYAIVALGALADRESLEVLLDRLRNGEDGEVTSAIWALARRKDGVDDVLNLAGDARRWVNDEVLGAFAEVAAGVSDEQIAELDRRLSNPEFARFRERHIDRTRRGAAERGPDARVDVVRRH